MRISLALVSAGLLSASLLSEDLTAGVPGEIAHHRVHVYSGLGDEFIEFTNVGGSPVDMTGWSYDDNSAVLGTVDLSGFGVVNPGESVILTEADPAVFTSDWSLTGVKIVGFLDANIGRNDEINLWDNNGVLIDQLTYGDEDFPGTIRAKEFSAWTFEGNVGKNNIYFWLLAEVGDAQGSVLSLPGDIGSPGTYTPTAPTQSFGRLNEIYSSHTSTDDQEFVEIHGIPGGPLTNVMLLVVEGDGAWRRHARPRDRPRRQLDPAHRQLLRDRQHGGRRPRPRRRFR